MNFFKSIAGILLIGFLNSAIIAGQVYTWTDENGNLHVTDTPPPAKSIVKDTLEYQEKSAAEIQEIERQKSLRQDQKSKEALLSLLASYTFIIAEVPQEEELEELILSAIGRHPRFQWAGDKAYNGDKAAR